MTSHCIIEYTRPCAKGPTRATTAVYDGMQGWPYDRPHEAEDLRVISGQGQGLLAVVTGAAIIVAFRQVIRIFRKSAPYAHQLKSECAKLVALSEDLQKRMMRERQGLSAADEVHAWDARAYRLAKRRLGNFSPSAAIQTAVTELDETRAELKAAWRQSLDRCADGREDLLTVAMSAHSEAIDNLAAASSILVRISWPFAQPAESR